MPTHSDPDTDINTIPYVGIEVRLSATANLVTAHRTWMRCIFRHVILFLLDQNWLFNSAASYYLLAEQDVDLQCDRPSYSKPPPNPDILTPPDIPISNFILPFRH